MPSYKVYWSKRYYTSGTVKIGAESFREAEKIARENIGDYEGHMEYDPDGDEVEAYYDIGDLKRDIWSHG